jgi:hypothetical protein
MLRVFVFLQHAVDWPAAGKKHQPIGNPIRTADPIFSNQSRASRWLRARRGGAPTGLAPLHLFVGDGAHFRQHLAGFRGRNSCAATLYDLPLFDFDGARSSSPARLPSSGFCCRWPVNKVVWRGSFQARRLEPVSRVDCAKGRVVVIIIVVRPGARRQD